MLDHAAVERAESEIDQFILKRNREREDANKVEAAWAETTRRYNEKRRREMAAEWREFHLRAAEGLERTAASLAADHRAKAEALSQAGEGVLS